LRFRVLRGGTDTDEREVVGYMGDASRADRYRLLVGPRKLGQRRG